mgnify:CR=1 FL=1
MSVNALRKQLNTMPLALDKSVNAALPHTTIFMTESVNYFRRNHLGLAVHAAVIAAPTGLTAPPAITRPWKIATPHVLRPA